MEEYLDGLAGMMTKSFLTVTLYPSATHIISVIVAPKSSPQISMIATFDPDG